MQVVRLALILVSAVLLVGVQAGVDEPPSAEAAFPGANGKIVFASANGKIVTIDPDGTGRTEVADGVAPKWSPDGGKIAFGSGDIFVVDTAGSQPPVNITNAAGELFSIPTWSPDGAKIASERVPTPNPNAEVDVFVMDANGGNRQNITPGGGGVDVHPAWSPDGARIAFASFPPGLVSDGIFTISPTGAGRSRLTTGDDWFPNWSPDGLRIAFQRTVGSEKHIFVFGLDGNPPLIPVDRGPGVWPAWSPDGTKIAFSLRPAPGLLVMNADGTEREIISAEVATYVDWQPLDGQCTGSAAAVGAAATDDDTDGDNIPDNVENNVTHTDPDCQDTDGDGLLDPWEVPPGTEGAGFDLDGDGDAEVKRDEVFGPYAGQCLDLTGPRFERLGQHCGLVHPPDPLHKDVYVEMDWQDCFEGFCPELVGIAVDPSHHAPDMAGLLDVVNMFSNAPVENPDDVDGVNLHILVDEPIKHIHNCDQAPAATRATNFGTEEQQASAQKIQAKAMAFRYSWSGHSSTRDDTPNQCPLPSLFVIAQAGAGLGPLPFYDISEPGHALPGGRDVLVTLAVSWICQLYSFDLPGIVGNLPPCFRKIVGITTGILPGLFPADISLPNGGTEEVPLPMHMLLGIPPSEAVEQLWGRTFGRYLGTALGVPTASLGNDPRTTGSQPVNSYGSWQGLSYAPPSGASPASLSAAGAGDAEPIMPDYTLADQDQDGDGVIERDDNCPALDNPVQSDIDGDGTGDDCDDDPDGDGLVGGADSQPGDTDNDGTPNETDTDDDADGVADGDDNCPVAANPAQADADTDGTGDPCDGDRDGDGLPDFFELLVGTDPDDPAGTPEFVGNGDSCSDGQDNDGDGDTDGADSGCLDPDGDTVPSSIDNCPALATNNLQDSDGDGTGDPCEPPGELRTWGDNNCSGSADPVDALLALRFDAGQSTNTGACPAMGVVVEVQGASPHPWGDIDCTGDVGPVDGLKLLRFDSGLSVAQGPGCPAMGGPVSVAVAALPARSRSGFVP